jgi:hypothetical protein
LESARWHALPLPPTPIHRQTQRPSPNDVRSDLRANRCPPVTLPALATLARNDPFGSAALQPQPGRLESVVLLTQRVQAYVRPLSPHLVCALHGIVILP